MGVITKSATCFLALVGGSLPAVALADSPFDLPMSGVAAHYDRANDRLEVAVLAEPDERLGRLSARRDSARRRAIKLAELSLHRYVDSVLATIPALPWHVEQVHRAIDEHRTIDGTRGFGNGSALVLLRVEASALRAAIDQVNLPWSTR